MFESADPEALRSANVALSGRKRREVTRLASIELRSTGPESGSVVTILMRLPVFGFSRWKCTSPVVEVAL